jgi:hypothetical protein
MFLVVNAEGKYWDGIAWTQKGREFFSLAAATRSLHEEGEDVDSVIVLPTADYENDPS